MRVVRLVTAGTLDESILALQQRKKARRRRPAPPHHFGEAPQNDALIARRPLSQVLGARLLDGRDGGGVEQLDRSVMDEILSHGLRDTAFEL